MQHIYIYRAGGKPRTRLLSLVPWVLHAPHAQGPRIGQCGMGRAGPGSVREQLFRTRLLSLVPWVVLLRLPNSLPRHWVSSCTCVHGVIMQ